MRIILSIKLPGVNIIAEKSWSSREFIKILETNGWVLIRIVGSHHHFKHARKQGKVKVKHPQKDVPYGTFLNILTQAGLE